MTNCETCVRRRITKNSFLRRQKSRSDRRFSTISLSCALALYVVLVPFISSANGFISLRQSRAPSSYLLSGNDAEADILRQLERARTLLQKTKAKLEAKAANGKLESAAGGRKISALNGQQLDEPLPYFFACLCESSETRRRREIVIKSKDESTGQVVADGEKMASLSEQEEWEVRSLYDVFKDENQEAFSMATSQLAERDVAASIYNLRKTLMMEDYKRIFDKNNRFIGEDN